jgi:uncharacterized protein YjbJ (UPF0337 family)
MSGSTDKASGLANVAIGKVKQGIGSAINSDDLKERGAAQELKGHAQQAVGDAKAAVEGASDDRESRIRERAYRIWEEEGTPDGHDYEHWRQAEREVDGDVIAPNI